MSAPGRYNLSPGRGGNSSPEAGSDPALATIVGVSANPATETISLFTDVLQQLDHVPAGSATRFTTCVREGASNAALVRVKRFNGAVFSLDSGGGAFLSGFTLTRSGFADIDRCIIRSVSERDHCDLASTT